jgi:hypothetical protein
VHDHPTDLDTYEWPTCVTPGCGRQLWVSESHRWACRPCEEATAKRLAELPALYRQLDTTAALMRGASRQGGGTGGTKTPPIPPRLEVLALTANGGIATRLQAIEDSWRQTLGWEIPSTTGERTTFPLTREAGGRVRAGEPVKGDRVYPHWRTQAAQKTVPEHATFLFNNLPWACESYEPVGQDIAEIRKLHGEMTALASGEKRPGRVPTGLCPAPDDDGHCGQQLTASTNSHRIRCKTCGAAWETLGEWRTLRAAQEAVIEEQRRQAEELEAVA